MGRYALVYAPADIEMYGTNRNICPPPSICLSLYISLSLFLSLSAFISLPLSPAVPLCVDELYPKLCHIIFRWYNKSCDKTLLWVTCIKMPI